MGILVIQAMKCALLHHVHDSGIEVWLLARYLRKSDGSFDVASSWHVELSKSSWHEIVHLVVGLVSQTSFSFSFLLLLVPVFSAWMFRHDFFNAGRFRSDASRFGCDASRVVFNASRVEGRLSRVSVFWRSFVKKRTSAPQLICQSVSTSRRVTSQLL